MGRWRWMAMGLAAGLVIGCLGGCSDQPSESKTTDAVSGKTPVVRPEDVHRSGADGSAVLSPDYRRNLDASSGAAASASPIRAAATALDATPETTPKHVFVPPTVVAGKGFPVPGCRQLVLVVATDWPAHRGVLRRLTRTGADAPWKVEGESQSCQLGRHGLGVGRGLDLALTGPAKREGDGRSPAGLFALSESFGAATLEAAQAAGVRLPYRQINDRVSCVTDVQSPLFGQIVGPQERQGVRARRQDRMWRADGANAWGVVIDHNRQQPEATAGSCVFLNVRAAGGPPTGGSIGLPEPQAAALVAWLDPSAKPLLLVLPERDYQARKAAWRLP